MHGLTFQIDVTTPRATCTPRCCQVIRDIVLIFNAEKERTAKGSCQQFQHFEPLYFDGQSIPTLFIKRYCNICCRYHTNTWVIKLWSSLGAIGYHSNLPTVKSSLNKRFNSPYFRNDLVKPIFFKSSSDDKHAKIQLFASSFLFRWLWTLTTNLAKHFTVVRYHNSMPDEKMVFTKTLRSNYF